jgi:WD40 repeat protein
MPPRTLIITVHGIRTFGQWQKRLEIVTKAAAAAQSDSFVFMHKNYGYFSVFRFLNPFARRAEVRRFAAELSDLLGRHYDPAFDRICLVGHSFGTHIIAYALSLLPASIQNKIDTVILSGSVLPRLFPWDKLIGTRVMRVVNDCGDHDLILPINALLPFGSGVGGRNGFEGITDSNFTNRYFEFGHSGYFYKSNKRPEATTDNWFMARYWVPLLLGGSPIEDADERKSTPFSGLMVGLVDRTERFKWVIPAIMLSIAVGIVSYQAKLKRDAIEQETRAHEAEKLAQQERRTKLQNLVSSLASDAQVATASGDAITGTLLAIAAVDIQLNEKLQPPNIAASRNLYTSYVRLRETASQIVEKGAVWAARSNPAWLAVPDNPNGILVIDAGTGQAITRLPHQGRVSGLTFATDHRTLLALDVNIAHVWDIDTQKEIGAIGKPGAGVWHTTFCGSARRIAVTPSFGSAETGIALWTDGVETLLASSADMSNLADIRCSDDGSRVAAYDSTDGVMLIDTEHDTQLAKFESRFGFAPPIFSADAKTLLLGDVGDGSLALVDATSGSMREISPEQPLTSWQISPNGKLIVGGSRDGTVYAWNLQGDSVGSWKVHSSGVTSVAMDHQDKRILFGATDGSLRILNIQTGNQTSLFGHNKAIVDAFFDPTAGDDDPESAAISASKDGVVILWDIDGANEATQMLVLRTELAELSGVQWRYPAVVGNMADKGFVAWNARPSSASPNLGILAISRDGNVVAQQARDEKKRRVIKLSDPSGTLPRALIYFKGHTDQITPKVALSTDGKYLLTTGPDKSLRLWDTSAGTQQHAAEGLSAEVTAIAFRPDGAYLAVGSKDGTVSLWNVDPLKKLAEQKLHTQQVSSIEFDPKGARFLATSRDGSFAIYDSASGDVLRKRVLDSKERLLGSYNTDLVAGAFNKDTSRIVTADVRGAVTLWDADTLEKKNQLLLHAQGLPEIVYDPSGTRIVYAGYVLDAEQFQVLVEPSQANMWSVTQYFTAGGSKTLSRDFSGNLTAKPFFSNDADLVREARSIVPRCLTPRQRDRFNLPSLPPTWCVEMKK